MGVEGRGGGEAFCKIGVFSRNGREGTEDGGGREEAAAEAARVALSSPPHLWLPLAWHAARVHAAYGMASAGHPQAARLHTHAGSMRAAVLRRWGDC